MHLDKKSVRYRACKRGRMHEETSMPKENLPGFWNCPKLKSETAQNSAHMTTNCVQQKLNAGRKRS